MGALVTGLGEIVPNTLSRLDLACDIQGMDFTNADFRNLVCAASYRATHEDGEGMTYQLGEGDAVMRIYRKDAELRANNKLSYAQLWERVPGYDPAAPVWRIEIQLRGSILKELGSRSVDVAFTKLGQLFAFGMSWCELRVPNADSTKKRWPVDLRWKLISSFWGASSPEPRVRTASVMERQEKVVARLVGACASLGAYSDKSDLLEVLMYALPTMESYLKDRDQDFGKLQADKVARIASEVAQGGWPHRAPTGYLNDKNTRTVVVDQFKGPLVAYAFERYGTGAVCLTDLCTELASLGLVTKSGKQLPNGTLQQLLTNPFFCGRVRHNGEVFPGAHTPLISPELFERVQSELAVNRNGTKSRKPEYPLRGAMRCAECGCLITAGTHKEHVYYRCTHGKGKGSCSQNAYIRQESLMAEVEAILGTIEIGPEVLEALVADCETYLIERAAELKGSHGESSREIETLKAKEKRLLDGFLDGAVPQEVYKERAGELATTRRTLELAVSEGTIGPLRTIQEVRDLAAVASSARVTFQNAPDNQKRDVLSTLLCNLDVQEGRIASYQWKGPFELLEMESSGAYKYQWWAIEDLNL